MGGGGRYLVKRLLTALCRRRGTAVEAAPQPRQRHVTQAVRGGCGLVCAHVSRSGRDGRAASISTLEPDS